MMPSSRFGSIFTSIVTNDISDIRRVRRLQREAEYQVLRVSKCVASSFNLRLNVPDISGFWVGGSGCWGPGVQLSGEGPWGSCIGGQFRRLCLELGSLTWIAECSSQSGAMRYAEE